ncbi:phage holin family protein [Algibacter sp. 2305UL17-15]|uniref:phage holin family protein n=1 Tax=Algibacter sp. 2305UL17-15 TaxID=3231268 RepID=UPI00345A2934
MGLIDSINETHDKASNIGERYIKTSYKYYKLKFFHQLSISVTMVFKALIIGGLALICILLGAVALALFVGESMANYPLGFLIVGAIFMILSSIAYLFRRVINKVTIKRLSKNFSNNNMKIYSDIESVERDLKILKLERDIAWEEIKAVKEDYKEDFRPYNWIRSGLKLASRFGVLVLLKKIIK